MTAIQLLSGAYSSAALLASAQRCVNLYPEVNRQTVKAGSPVTHLLAPGLDLLFQFPDATVVRGLYTASNGEVYGVCGPTVYWLQNGLTPVSLGTIANATTPVRMADNGQDILLVDGTVNGYDINLKTNVMTQLSAANNSGLNGYGFPGFDWVDFVDTFLFGNQINTSYWNSSLSLVMKFDSLGFAGKSGNPDQVMATVVLQRNIWVLGQYSSEMWNNVGNSPFPFALTPGPYIEAGLAGKYGLARNGKVCVFLAQNKEGQFFAVKIENYQTQVVSTAALEYEWAKYSDYAQAQGFAFTSNGHMFVGFRFPVSDKTWVLDIGTGEWHERQTEGTDGSGHQWRVNCATMGHGRVYAGDYANGKVYAINPFTATDAGTPIRRIRSFPHIYEELNRIVHWLFRLDMMTGGALAPTTASIANVTPASKQFLYDQAAPQIQLRISNDRGQSWNTTLTRPLARQGDGKHIIDFRRMGIARDRVYELSWTAPQITALNGAFLLPAMSVS